MPRLSDQELAALLEAGNGYCALDDMCAICVAHRHLAALAPALAQELIEKREAGGVLAEAMEEYERMWEAANACPECVGSLCADHALKLILARTTAKDALARWAELAETEVRDGLL